MSNKYSKFMRNAVQLLSLFVVVNSQCANSPQGQIPLFNLPQLFSLPMQKKILIYHDSKTKCTSPLLKIHSNGDKTYNKNFNYAFGVVDDISESSSFEIKQANIQKSIHTERQGASPKIQQGKVSKKSKFCENCQENFANIDSDKKAAIVTPISAPSSSMIDTEVKDGTSESYSIADIPSNEFADYIENFDFTIKNRHKK